MSFSSSSAPEVVPVGAASSAASGDGEPTTAELLAQLGQDRLWLLRQLDAGQWPQWRLDLAALERELGQMLELAADRLT
ncbi:MAG: hypothetical protein VKK62_06035 [Synechococcaceae cyanobacterium]|nr:hypothetical protein [Synechococcaceae cyanobacterium]